MFEYVCVCTVYYLCWWRLDMCVQLYMTCLSVWMEVVRDHLKYLLQVKKGLSLSLAFNKPIWLAGQLAPGNCCFQCTWGYKWAPVLPTFTWVLGIWTQIHMLGRQASILLSNHKNICFYIIKHFGKVNVGA